MRCGLAKERNCVTNTGRIESWRTRMIWGKASRMELSSISSAYLLLIFAFATESNTATWSEINLPVGFASRLSLQQNGNMDQTLLNNAMNKLAEIVWKKRAFGSSVEGWIWILIHTHISVLRCSACSLFSSKKDSTIQSYLTFSPVFEDRILSFTL